LTAGGRAALLQTKAASLWVENLSSVPECLGGHWFQAYDGTSWTGFGLVDGAGNKRPSYAAYQAAIS